MEEANNTEHSKEAVILEIQAADKDMDLDTVIPAHDQAMEIQEHPDLVMEELMEAQLEAQHTTEAMIQAMEAMDPVMDMVDELVRVMEQQMAAAVMDSQTQPQAAVDMI